MQMNLDEVGVREGVVLVVCSHGQNTTLAAECCMWRDGNIEYPATRTIPEFNIAEKKIHIPIPEILAVKYHQEKSPFK